MKNRFYPYGYWCEKYCMWCGDVVELMDGNNECNGDCINCSDGSEEDMNNFCEDCDHMRGDNGQCCCY